MNDETKYTGSNVVDLVSRRPLPSAPDAAAPDAEAKHHTLRDILLEINAAAGDPQEVRRRVGEALGVLDKMAGAAES